MSRLSEPQMKLLLKLLCERYGVREEELDALLKEPQIPATAFNSTLAPMESVVKYLRDAHGLTLVEIAGFVGRDPREIGVASRRAQGKMQQPLSPAPTEHMIPVRLFADRRLSVLEHVVAHLRAKGLRLSEIAQLIQRDDRTVWTVVDRRNEKLYKK